MGPNESRIYPNNAQIANSRSLEQVLPSTGIQNRSKQTTLTKETKYRPDDGRVNLSTMCYYLVFGHLICNNDHPQPGSGEIFQRQCRKQAEDSQRAGKWEVKCDRSTPPFFIFEKPNMHMIVTDNLDCKTCCQLMADPELAMLQAVSDEISDRRNKKKELHARLVKRLVRDIYLRPVTTDAEYIQWQQDCERWEKCQTDIESEIKSLTDDLGQAEKQWADKKHEIEEPDEDDFIDVALEEYERFGNQDGGQGHLFYFGVPTMKEALEHPYCFPRCFPGGRY